MTSLFKQESIKIVLVDQLCFKDPLREKIKKVFRARNFMIIKKDENKEIKLRKNYDFLFSKEEK